MSCRDGANFSGSLLVAAGAISGGKKKVLIFPYSWKIDDQTTSFYFDFLPVFCSVIGVVARGTDFMSKGFSDGSKVYWCRAFSRPGMETDRPGSSRRHPLITRAHTHILKSAQTICVCVFFYFFTIEDVGCIQSLLLLLQYVHVEGGSVPHFIITVHHAPTGTDGFKLHWVKELK